MQDGPHGIEMKPYREAAKAPPAARREPLS